MRIRQSDDPATTYKCTDLSYDYIMVNGSCSNFEPAIIDTDGALRWVGTGWRSRSVVPSSLITQSMWVMAANCLESSSMALSPSLGDYSSLGIANFHHNIDRGKVGIILDARYHNILRIDDTSKWTLQAQCLEANGTWPTSSAQP